MAKKQNRRARRSGRSREQGTLRSARKQFLSPPSLIFLGLIVLIVAVAAAAMMFRGDVPECPPGQVWSDAHGHCH